MWQCKYCREKFIEEDKNHICVTDVLSSHFKGRRALLEPLFRVFVQKLQKLPGIIVESTDSFILLKTQKHDAFATIRVAQDHLEVFLKLPENTPISPAMHSAERLRIQGMSHYFSLHSVGDVTSDILRSLMWAKEYSEVAQ